jgi:hypothetical protein
MAVGNLSPQKIQAIKDAAEILISAKLDIRIPQDMIRYLDALSADCAGYLDKPALPATAKRPDRM